MSHDPVTCRDCGERYDPKGSPHEDFCDGSREDLIARVEALQDAATVLLSVEWGGWNGTAWGHPGCPSCRANADAQGHKPGCALDAALTRAGMR